MLTNGTITTNDLVLLQLSNISNKTIEFIERHSVRIPENNWSPQKKQVLTLEQIREVITLSLVTIDERIKKGVN